MQRCRQSLQRRVLLPVIQQVVSQLEPRFTCEIRTLGFVHVAGRIETARSDRVAAFTHIFEQVKDRITEAEDMLADFLRDVRANASYIMSVGRIDPKRFDELESMLAA